MLVKGLSTRTRPRDLYRVFERFGRVKDVYLPRDYYSRVSKGFAFVEYVDFVCAKVRCPLSQGELDALPG